MSRRPIRPLPPQAVLRALLDYDPATGLLRWRARPGNRSFNTRFAGQIAFTALDGNYWRGELLGQSVYAHRVVWKWWHGVDADEVDHESGCGTDNRIRNLRSVTGQQNACNQALNRNNKSGFSGVYWYPRYAAYQVMIGTRYIGRFSTLDEAVEARQAAELAENYHPNHGRLRA